MDALSSQAEIVKPPIPVGVRLPLGTRRMDAKALVELCAGAVEMGYESFWVGDHILMPDLSGSVYPHTIDGAQPFKADTPWLDPLLMLSWIGSIVPGARLGTSIVILTLRKPALLAKQISTLSWLAGRPITIGIGTGWLREEYEAVGMPFKHRATQAISDLAEIRQLLTKGERPYRVHLGDGDESTVNFHMRPVSENPVAFLWGGVSPLALKIVANSCDGWLPAKQTIASLETNLERLRAECEEVERDYNTLRRVVKPGPGPDPIDGSISRDGLAAYAELGFDEAILEMPYEPGGITDALATLEQVAQRSWL